MNGSLVLESPRMDDLQRCLQSLEQYDMWFVAERIQRDGLIPASEIEQSIARFKQFAALFAVGYSNVSMPMKRVDIVWHTFILFTEEYAYFCERYLGQFLHHKPITSRTQTCPEAGIDFYELYEHVFGQDLREEESSQETCCGGGSDCRSYPDRMAVSVC